MCFGRLWPWGGRSPASSKPQKASKRRTKRDKKAKTFDSSRAKHRLSSDENSNDESIIPNERQTDGPFQGLANGFRDVGIFLNQLLSNPRVCYMIAWVLFAHGSASSGMAIIDIADRNETKTSFWDRWFTTGQPYTRARGHHSHLLSITNDMIKASTSEMERLEDYRDELARFATLEDHHGAICGLRSRTLKSVRRWTKETKDIRAEVKVMCNSSKRSKLKLGVALGVLKHHLASVDAAHKGPPAPQHDRAETLEAALLSYCKSLLEAMQTLAKFGNA